jgi:rubrerythrin
MFFKALRSRRHSSKDSCSVCDKTSMPSDSPSHRNSQPSCAHTGSHSTSHTQSQSQDGSTSAGRTDYEVFLEKARREEEERARIRQQEIRDAERRRREFTLDPWAGKI